MYRPALAPPSHSQRWQETWARLLAPLTLWLCVSISLRYGYYGSRHMVLGPSSSRLMKASSVFVQQIEVRDDDKKEVYLYGFSEKPELTVETNWTVSKYLIVGSYSRQGFSLWLNKGSNIRMRLEAQTSCLSNLQVVLLKGERNSETLLPNLTTSPYAFALKEPIEGRQAEYTIEEDDRYYVGIINANPRSIIMAMNVNVSSKMYDISKAKSMCSKIKGACQLKLPFPNTHFVVVTTPNNGDLGGWYVELSFVARIVTYIAIFGFVVIVIFLVLKYLGACDGQSNRENNTTLQEISIETDPLIPEKAYHITYGSLEEGRESGPSNSSSEDLYDGKICVICYDAQRNCFFVPCGHCATCFDCAQRIIEGENKVCPICRRYIHKVRKLISR